MCIFSKISLRIKESNGTGIDTIFRTIKMASMSVLVRTKMITLKANLTSQEEIALKLTMIEIFLEPNFQVSTCLNKCLLKKTKLKIL